MNRVLDPSSPLLGRSPVPTILRRTALALLPRRFHIPARYHYRRLFGTLDPEFALLPSLADRATRAVDVGAALGVYTYRLAGLCRRVDVFEPVPRHAELLRTLRASNVTVHQMALSDEQGERNLYFEGDTHSADYGQASLSAAKAGPSFISVTARPLDDYEFPDVCFIKVDVEGHELEVLKGATNTLHRTRPNLLVEIEQRHLSYPMDVVFTFLRDLDYRGFFLEGGQLRPLGEFCYERHQEPWLQHRSTPGYVNNFIFYS